MKERGENFVYLFEGTPYINLTNRCCNDCSFCLRNGRSGVASDSLWLVREPTVQEVLEQFDAIANGLDDVPKEAVFCGFGEPCTRIDVLVTLASVLKSRGCSVRLNTNGLGNLIAGRDITDELARVVDTVSISLNASDAAAYQKLCKPSFGLKSFDALLTFARDCVAKGIKVILTVVEPLCEEELSRCRAIALGVGAALRVRKRIE